MRILVCGGRNYNNWEKVKEVLELFYDKRPEIIHGGAMGADNLAGRFAETYMLSFKVFTANWKNLGLGAGPIRNQEMLDSGVDLVIAFPGGRGTADMINRAKRKGVTVLRVE